MKKFFILFLSLSLSFAGQGHTTESQTLRIQGSNTIGANLAPEIVRSWLLHKGYEILSDKVTAKEEHYISAVKSDDEINVEIHAHGSSTFFKDFSLGKTDVAISSRPIKAKELQQLSLLGDLSSKNSEYVMTLNCRSQIMRQHLGAIAIVG